MPPKREKRELNTARLSEFKPRLLQEYPQTAKGDAFTNEEFTQFNVSFFNDKATNPEFIGGGKPVSLGESNDFFKALLQEEGCSETVANTIFQKFIQPLNDKIVEQTRVLEAIEKKQTERKTASPFDALASLKDALREDAEEEPVDLEKQKEAELAKFRSMQQSRMLLMREIFLNPQNYNLDPESYGDSGKGVRLSAKTFIERVQNGTTQDLFSVNGAEISLEAKKQLAQEVVMSLFDTTTLSLKQKESIDVALQLLKEKCIQSLFDDIAATPSLDAPDSFKDRLRKQKISQLQQFLTQVSKDPQNMVGKYGAYIWGGTYDPELVYFPKLSLRLPEGLKQKINSAKNSTEKKKLEKEGWDTVVSTYNERQLQQIVDSYSLKDRAGYKPEGLIAAELTNVLQSLGYDPESMAVIGDRVVKPYFEKIKEIGAELRRLSGMRGSQTEVKAQKRLRKKAELEFIEHTTMYLQNPDYFQLDSSMLLIEHKTVDTAELASATQYEILAMMSIPARAGYAEGLFVSYTDAIKKSVEAAYETDFDSVIADNEDIRASHSRFQTAVETLLPLLTSETLDKQKIDALFETIDEEFFGLTEISTD